MQGLACMANPSFLSKSGSRFYCGPALVYKPIANLSIRFPVKVARSIKRACHIAVENFASENVAYRLALGCNAWSAV